ncbi:MAG: hypothetical protein C5S38_03820 [Candidatus Methanophagaceae archaeon]|nr:MAG: hypothetical protein C5S38_03820 [Methanophagales archaeon]
MIGNLAGMHPISTGCGLVEVFTVIIYERTKRL